MNSIEELAKEQGGAIEALSLIGLSAIWIGALAAHPAVFKQYLREQKRNSARLVHPDQGQTDLSKRAAEIYGAFDLLSETDDVSLSKAMRQFTDKFSVPRVEVLNLISSLKAEKEKAEAKLRTEVSERKKAEEKNKKEPVNHDASNFLALLTSQFNSPEVMTKDKGQMKHITDLANTDFHTTLSIFPDDEYPERVIASVSFYHVSPGGEVFRSQPILGFPNSKSELEIKAAFASQDSAKSDGTRTGEVIGFVQSSAEMDNASNDYETPFFPKYDPDTNEELKKKSSSDAFIQACLKEMRPKGLFVPPDEQAGKSHKSSMPSLGVVVLEGYTSAKEKGGTDEVSFAIIYIEDFINFSSSKPKRRQQE